LPRKRPVINFIGKNNAIKSVFDVSKPEKKKLSKNIVKAAAIAAKNAAE
jgi:hypothetical protein